MKKFISSTLFYTLIRKLFILLFISITTLSTTAQTFEWGGVTDLGTFSYPDNTHISENNNIYLFYRSGNNPIDVDLSSSIIYSYPTNNNTNQNGRYVIVTKYDSNSAVIWYKTIVSITNSYTANVKITSVDTDDSENVYVCGTYNGVVDFDPSTTSDYIDSTHFNNPFWEVKSFILKLDVNGDFLWVKNYTEDQIYNLEIVGNRMVLTGRLPINGFDFDLGAGVDSISTNNWMSQYVHVMDLNANHMWVEEFLDFSYYLYPSSLIVDENDDVYYIGNYLDTISFTWNSVTHTLNGSDSTNIYVLKFNLQANILDLKGINPTPLSSTKIKSVDYNNGKLYLLGICTGIVDFDMGSGVVNSSLVDSNYFALVMDSALNYEQYFVFPDKVRCDDIAADGFNNYFISGEYNVVTDIDPTSSYYFADIDSDSSTSQEFYIKMNSQHQFNWAITYIVPDTFHFADPYNSDNMVVDNDNNLYISGRFSNLQDYDFTQDSLYFDNSWGSGYNYLIKVGTDTLCGNYIVLLDSLENISCIQNGYISGVASGGSPPYIYSWDTGVLDSFINVNSTGMYTLTVTDQNNCVKTPAAIVNGPTTQLGYDLQLNMITNGFQSGFTHNIWLDAFNEGCTLISGQFGIVLDSSVTYNSSSIPPNYINGDTLIWDFYNWVYGTHMQPVINITTSVNSIAGTQLCFPTFITPDAADLDISNNYRNYCYTVVNAYDPNDKSLYPMGPCNVNYALDTEILTYTIRFQNTGNALAHNIYVLDQLNANLDISTVNILANTHHVITEVLPNNTLKFRFDNIMLPDSTTNEPNSHGYFVFEVQTLPNIPYGTQIDNSVGIYFDFNPPVLTNTVSTIIVNSIPTPANINTALSSNSVCEGASTLANISSSFSSVVWEDGFVNNIIIPNQSDWFSVSAIDSNGCTTHDSVFVVVNLNPTLEATINDSIICAGDTAIASINQTFDNIIWSTGDNSITTTAQNSGWYTVWATDANGCSSIDSVYLSVNPLPNVYTISQIGDSIFVPYDSNYSYQWHNGGGVIVINETGFWLIPDGNGDYNVVVSDSNGCQQWSNTYNFSSVGLSSELQSQAKIYPNPFIDYTYLEFDKIQKNTIVEMLDVNGEILRTYRVKEKRLLIERKDLPVGMYMLRIGNDISKLIAD